jgi:salicylate hydroxylase
MAESNLRVAIIGAGIGGLSLGLALQERGIQADVFEQAPELTEIGAAIALSANSIREYTRLGLTPELATRSTIPTELIYRHWQDGSRIAANPVRQDGWYEKRFGAPYFGIHRADLQKTLSGAFSAGHLHLGCRLVNLVQEPDSVRLEFANGRVERADIVVGADGVRSAVRRWVTGADDAVYSGTSAFRGIVPTENLGSLPDPHAIQFWMGPDAHLLHYAIGGHGESVNFFAVVETPKIWPHAGSTAEVPEELPVASFRGWHPAVTEMIRAAASPISWALFTVRPLLRWYRNRMVILGDAAHGMLPHHGQGANTSIEDAFALAALLAEPTGDALETTFARFQALRRTRTRKIQRSSWVTSSLLHLPDGPAARLRNDKVARVAQDFGWIHEYDTQLELQKIGCSPAPSSTGTN